ncbi:hypothetical protein [Dactylosporangium sp. NPDC048998]|uniref:hypothetical protein n=1 Tax=Dactylosporangium sp. NPDC048998 TaxID=3363976 RepID=UPI00371CC397
MPRSSTFKSTLFTGSAVLTFLLTGCGSSSDAPRASATDGAAAATDGAAGGGKKTCAIAPASLINSTLGITAGDPEEQDNGSVTVCTYSGTTIVRFDTATDAAAFATEKQTYAPHGMKTTDIPGFADEAYYATLSAVGITTNTVVARKGSIEVQISSKATVDQEKALAEKLFALL